MRKRVCLLVALAACVLIALGAQIVVASPMVSMPSVDGGVVWTGVDGVFQKWDDGSWVYVWQAAPEEPAPQSRWPDREMVEQHILSFAGRQWTGGYLEKAEGDQTEDRVMVAQDDGGTWCVALYVPTPAFEGRANSVVQALKGLNLGEVGGE